MLVAEKTTIDFKNSLIADPLYLSLTIDGYGYDFYSNGELVEEGEQAEEGYQKIWMYAEEDGEVIAWAEVDIEIETRGMMDYIITEHTPIEKEYERPYHYLNP